MRGMMTKEPSEEEGLLSGSESEEESPLGASRLKTWAAFGGAALLLLGVAAVPTGLSAFGSPTTHSTASGSFVEAAQEERVARPSVSESAPRGAQLAADRTLAVQEGAQGTVEAIYTYGGPGSASKPLPNLLSEDGCFNGLRAYTEDVLGPVTKQVDAAAISNSKEHPKVPVAVLRWNQDSLYVPCPGKPIWPNDRDGTVFGEWSLHWEEDYVPRLKHIKVNGTDSANKDPFKTSQEFAHLAYKIYDSLLNAKKAIAKDVPGWKIVALETKVSGAGTLYDEDPVMIAQHSTTLDCALVFAGTNNVANELTSSTTTYGTGYCGFDDVHVGYRNELWHVTKALWPAIAPKLAKCGKVSCVGHSMGGPLCDIFAACANSGRTEDPDYVQQSWVVGAPEAMDEISEGGVALMPGAQKKCDQPPCD